MRWAGPRPSVASYSPDDESFRVTTRDGWAGLFWDAFKRSRNAMVLLDELRCHVDVNGAYLELVGYRRGALVGYPVYDLVEGGPMMSTDEWRATIAQDEFTGTAHLVRADGHKVAVQFAGHPELVTGKRLVLFVVLNVARAGRRVRADTADTDEGALSPREREVVELVALGYDGPEIAGMLQVAHNTVRTHVQNAMDKVGARSRAQLVAKSVAAGLTVPEADHANA
jgi:PAS domain S-box-containing protein